MLFTVNTKIEEISYIESNIESNNEELSVQETVNWIAEKFGIARKSVTVANLMTHLTVMAMLDAIDPASTRGENYDAAHASLHSAMICHVVKKNG